MSNLHFVMKFQAEKEAFEEAEKVRRDREEKVIKKKKFDHYWAFFLELRSSIEHCSSPNNL